MICQGCGSEFTLVLGSGSSRRVMCYDCQPVGGDRKQTYRNKHLKKKYGITQSQYTEMFNKQNGKCKLCDIQMIHQAGTLVKGSRRNGQECNIDHCHKTGRVRGLLCFHCNTALGHLDDNIDVIRKLEDYIKF